MLLACSADPGEDGTGEPAPMSAHDEPQSDGESGVAIVEPPLPAARVERTVFRLGDNRLLAHQSHGDAIFISAGSPGFAKYARFAMPRLTWKLGRTVDGQRVAMAEKSASIEVPLTAEQIDGAVLTMRIHSSKDRQMSIALNGRDRSRQRRRVELTRGWQDVTVPLASDHLVVGENVFEFEIKRSRPIAVAWLRIGPPPGDFETDPLPPLDLGYDQESDEFTLDRAHGLVFHVHVPDDGGLVADVSGTGSESPCAVAVRIRAHGIDLSETLRGESARIELGELSGRAVRFDLRAQGCSAVRLARARITVPGEPVESRRGPPPKYVILWLMDALRADRVRPFQPDARPEVPNLEKLAAVGTVFRQFWVQGNESQGSHSSIWTSLYPGSHRVRTAGDNQNSILSDDLAKIAGLMKELDFTTIAVTPNRFVSKGNGYATGFDVWRNLKREGKGRGGSIPAETMYDIAIEHFSEYFRDRKVYLFLSTYDTHKPWIARKPWIDRYDTRRYRGPHKRVVYPSDIGMDPGRMKCTTMPAPRDLERINAIYDSDVSYQDEQVGRLLDQLEDWGILDETLIIITADHGEELWEVGRCGHGASLRETLVRVPLVIHYPPLFPGGRMVTEGAESVDVLPSILDALGQEPLAAGQGHSLIPLAQGVRQGYPEPVYASQYEHAHAMRLGDWKLWVKRADRPRLYNLAIDPDEKKIFHTRRPIARRLVSDPFSLFMVYRHRWKKHLWGPASNMSPRAARDLMLLESQPSGRKSRRSR